MLDKLIRKEKAAHMDAVVRTWAHRDPLPAEYTKKADKIRMDYIRSLFEELGFKGQELEARSRLFYFYEAFEPMMTIKPKVGTVDELAVMMLKILTDR